MNRRSFFWLFAAVPLAPLMAKQDLRVIEKLVDYGWTAKWVRCRMRALRKGDLFRVDQANCGRTHELCRALSNPRLARGPSGYTWTIEVCTQRLDSHDPSRQTQAA